MKNYTDMTILLDRSGSMESIKQSMESALNELFIQHRKIASTRATLIQFDGENPFEIVFENRPIKQVPKVIIEPRGWTPLCDAMCQSIDHTGARLKAIDHSDRPDKVLFIVITDGQENTSKRFNRNDVKRRVENQSTSYNWQFLYLGANQDAIAEGAKYGIAATRSMSFAANAEAVGQTVNSMISNTVAYSNTGTMRSLDWSDDDRKKAKTGDSNG